MFWKTTNDHTRTTQPTLAEMAKYIDQLEKQPINVLLRCLTPLYAQQNSATGAARPPMPRLTPTKTPTKPEEPTIDEMEKSTPNDKIKDAIRRTCFDKIVARLGEDASVVIMLAGTSAGRPVGGTDWGDAASGSREDFS